jgi:hypothetical protein
VTTIGDSFAVVAVLLGVGITAWAMILAFALMFPARSDRSRTEFELGPVKSFWIGLISLVTLGTLAIGLANAPLPPVKLLGTGLILLLISLGMMGLSGLSLMISARIRAMEPSLSLYASLCRATMLVVIACFFPFVGWFLVAPILFTMGLGVGMLTLRGREVVAAPPVIE